jgi:hypothetical protein
VIILVEVNFNWDFKDTRSEILGIRLLLDECVLAHLVFSMMESLLSLNLEILLLLLVLI